MEPLLPFWPYLSAAAFVVAAIGYALRLLQERYTQARLERALFALGGEIPDWEKRARVLEDRADRAELEGDASGAANNRKQARRVRIVARRRLRSGRSALPS